MIISELGDGLMQGHRHEHYIIKLAWIIIGKTLLIIGKTLLDYYVMHFADH